MASTRAHAGFTGDLLKQLSGIERTRAIALLTLFPIGPLALLRDLSALKHSTIAGLMAVAVSALVIVSRSLDGSYGEGGAFAGWLASSENALDRAPRRNCPWAPRCCSTC